MVQQIINGVVPVVVAGAVAVLTAIIKAVGGAVVEFVGTKTAAIKAKAGAEKWANWLTLGKQAWNIVDEEFRITPTLEKTFAAKQSEFAVQLKKLIPEISDEQIEQIRQAIAGEVNAGKAAVEAAAADADGDVLAGSASGSGASASGTTGAV